MVYTFAGRCKMYRNIVKIDYTEEALEDFNRDNIVFLFRRYINMLGEVEPLLQRRDSDEYRALRRKVRREFVRSYKILSGRFTEEQVSHINQTIHRVTSMWKESHLAVIGRKVKGRF